MRYNTRPSYKAESSARSLWRHSSTVTALLSPFVKTTSPLFQSKPVSLSLYLYLSTFPIQTSLFVPPVFACFLKPLARSSSKESVFQHSYFCVFFICPHQTHTQTHLTQHIHMAFSSQQLFYAEILHSAAV